MREGELTMQLVFYRQGLSLTRNEGLNVLLEISMFTFNALSFVRTLAKLYNNYK